MIHKRYVKMICAEKKSLVPKSLYNGLFLFSFLFFFLLFCEQTELITGTILLKLGNMAIFY